MSKTQEGIFNVFQPGLVRGAAKLAYAPHKRYFYVEHPTEGWRVYLRACCFLHEAGKPFQADRFLVVKATGMDASKKAWEPPKGQMEGKDANPKSASLIQLMAENVRREIEEESKITKIQGLKHTGLVIQSSEPDYPANHYFQYHIFQAQVTPATIEKAQKQFEWFKDHPEAFARLRKDKQEKDALAWFNASTTKLFGRWSPTIVATYVQEYASS